MSRHSDHSDHDDEQDDLGVTRTEADQLSHTRFGPRPVPEGHRPSYGPRGARRIPPSGPVSPDGQRAYPMPSRFAKWVVWGGTGIAAAALTAGTVYVARHVSDLLSDREPPRKRRRAHAKPRMQMANLAERAALRDRPPQPAPQPTARDPRREDVRPPKMQSPYREEARPPRPRSKPKSRAGIMHEIEDNTVRLSKGVDNLMGSLTAAVSGFRTVAAQATGIMREFSDAAAMVRGIMGEAPRATGAPARRPAPQARPPVSEYPDRHGAHMPDLRDDATEHDPLQDADFDPRTHRM